MSLESEIVGLRKTLRLPVAGQPNRTIDLNRLWPLVEQYNGEAHAIYAKIHGHA